MTTINSNIIHKVEYFDFLNYFFTDPSAYSRCSTKVKSGHLFQTFRALSIQYPVSIQALNKIHSVQILDALHSVFCKPGQNKPGWVFTKTKNVGDPTKKSEILSKFDIPIIMLFLENHGIEYKTLQDLEQSMPDYLNQELTNFANEFVEDKYKLTKSKNKKQK